MRQKKNHVFFCAMILSFAMFLSFSNVVYASDFDDVYMYCKNYGIQISYSKEFDKEVRKMIKERNISYSKLYAGSDLIKQSSSSSNGNPLKKKRFIPTSAYADIIWTNNPLTPFNHVGLYTNKNTITEALENGVKSRSVGKSMKEYPFNIYKVATQENGSTRYSLKIRKKVAAWCADKLDRGYDWNFANNKVNSKKNNAKFNCSELVWKSWKFNASVDLDSNGGKGVYPNNIKESKLTKYISGSK